MKCIYCTHKETDVVNSREVKKGSMIWRRRACGACGRVFTTRETARGDNAFVIKRNGARQRFMYEKVFASIFAVLSVRKDRDNGDNAALAKRLSERVLDGIAPMLGETNEVPTGEIIALVYKELKPVSKVLADYYLHYSDYRLQIAVARGLVSVPSGA